MRSVASLIDVPRFPRRFSNLTSIPPAALDA
jgi:hypothetical protein